MTSSAKSPTPKKMTCILTAISLIFVSVPLPFAQAYDTNLTLNPTGGALIAQTTPEEAVAKQVTTTPLPNPNAMPAGPLSTTSAESTPPNTVSNPNFSISERTVRINADTITYDDITENATGAVKLTVVKSKTSSVQTHFPTNMTALDVPDVSADGSKAVYVVERWCTSASDGCLPEQWLNVISMTDGKYLLSMDLGKSDADKITTAHMAAGSNDLVQVSFESGLIKYYSVSLGRALPLTVSNPNYFITERSVKVNADTITYYELRENATGAVKLTVVKSKTSSVQTHFPTNMTALDVPDVSADGSKAVYVVERWCTSASDGCLPEQWLNVISPENGKYLLSIDLGKSSADKIKDARMAASSNDLVKVTFQSGLVKYYSVSLGKAITPTASNPNYFFNVRQQSGSVSEVYDIYNVQGTLVTSLDKTTANIRGDFQRTLTPPDVSADGSRIIYSTFSQSSYTGHVIQSVVIKSYLISNGQPDLPWTTLVEKDNLVVTAAEKPSAVRFVPGSNSSYQVTYPGTSPTIVERGYSRTLSPAPSNALFTFEVIAIRLANGNYQQELRVYKSAASEIKVLSQLITTTQASPFSLTDVSGDGTRVVFANKAAKTQSGSDYAAHVYVGNTDGVSPSYSALGVYTSIVFSGNTIILRKSDGTVITLDKTTLLPI
jgi:hypothetical protein